MKILTIQDGTDNRQVYIIQHRNLQFNFMEAIYYIHCMAAVKHIKVAELEPNNKKTQPVRERHLIFIYSSRWIKLYLQQFWQSFLE